MSAVQSLKAAFQCFPFLDYAEILREIVESFAAEFLESLIVGQKVAANRGFLTVSCLTDDGLIDESDLREVMKACMLENGMEFDEKELRKEIAFAIRNIHGEL